MVLLSFNGNTQTSGGPDSTKIPNSQLRTMLKAANSAKNYRSLSNLLQKKVDTLNKRIDFRDQEIEALNIRVDANKKQAILFEQNWKLTEQQRAYENENAKQTVEQLNKSIKKLSRQKVANKIIYGIGGAILGAAIGITILK